MAKGDVVSDIQAIAGAGNLDFQPAAGVEVLIEWLGLEVNPQISAKFFNGTVQCVIVPDGTYTIGIERKRIFLNNTNYLRINNGTTFAQAIGYSGIQTK